MSVIKPLPLGAAIGTGLYLAHAPAWLVAGLAIGLWLLGRLVIRPDNPRSHRQSSGGYVYACSTCGRRLTRPSCRYDSISCPPPCQGRMWPQTQQGRR
jgi:hypothetical protein